MTKKRQDFEIWQGESKRLKVPITEGGAPKNLTGATATWVVYTSLRDSTVDMSKTTGGSGISIVNVDATNDGLQIDIDPANTEDLEPGDYYHECRVVDSGSREEVVFIGTMKLKESKTIQES